MARYHHSHTPKVIVQREPRACRQMGFFRLTGRLLLGFLTFMIIWNFVAGKLEDYRDARRREAIEAYLRRHLSPEDYVGYIAVRDEGRR